MYRVWIEMLQSSQLTRGEASTLHSLDNYNVLCRLFKQINNHAPWRIFQWQNSFLASAEFFVFFSLQISCFCVVDDLKGDWHDANRPKKDCVCSKTRGKSDRVMIFSRTSSRKSSLFVLSRNEGARINEIILFAFLGKLKFHLSSKTFAIESCRSSFAQIMSSFALQPTMCQLSRMTFEISLQSLSLSESNQ